MLGKEKCRMLRQIRQKIAQENDIALITKECTYQGQCKGTCPKCESELRYLEAELEKRRKLGKKVAVAALSAGIVAVGIGAVALEYAMIEKRFETAGVTVAETENREPEITGLMIPETEPPIREVTEGEIADWCETGDVS